MLLAYDALPVNNRIIYGSFRAVEVLGCKRPIVSTKSNIQLEATWGLLRVEVLVLASRPSTWLVFSPVDEAESCRWRITQECYPKQSSQDIGGDSDKECCVSPVRYLGRFAVETLIEPDDRTFEKVDCNEEGDQVDRAVL